jgi:NitT/TauT family transport system substrate-binding protein
MRRRKGGLRSIVTRRTFLQGSAGCIAAVSAVSVSSCAEEESPSGRSRTGTDGLVPFPFLAIVPPNSLTFAPELVADAAGHFSHEGLDVTIEVTRGSAQAIQLVLRQAF